MTSDQLGHTCLWLQKLKWPRVPQSLNPSLRIGDLISWHYNKSYMTAVHGAAGVYAEEHPQATFSYLDRHVAPKDGRPCHFLWVSHREQAHVCCVASHLVLPKCSSISLWQLTASGAWEFERHLLQAKENVFSPWVGAIWRHGSSIKRRQFYDFVFFMRCLRSLATTVVSLNAFCLHIRLSFITWTHFACTAQKCVCFKVVKSLVVHW